VRVLITGGAGLLGRELIETAPPWSETHATQRSTPVENAASHRIELSDAHDVATLFQRLRPEVVIHTAYSGTHPERDIWGATASVIAASASLGARLIYLSTDALLDGEHAPYSESAEPAPVHDYGRWKARAERHVRAMLPFAAVVRTSLITRLQPLDPRCAWVARSLRDAEPITLFTDEIRCPIAVRDLARQLWEIAPLPEPRQAGVWHLAGPEALSRYALGLVVAAHERLDPAGITPALSADAPTHRPRDLRLRTERADRELTTRARPISSLLLDDRSAR
jgi:dTDP-4-dehydrorhamnose reductase